MAKPGTRRAYLGGCYPITDTAQPTGRTVLGRITGMILFLDLKAPYRSNQTCIEACRVYASWYDQRLAGSKVQMPNVMPYGHHVYHIYAVRMPQQNALHQKLHTQGIQAGLHYPIPVHLQEAYANLGTSLATFPAQSK